MIAYEGRKPKRLDSATVSRISKYLAKTLGGDCVLLQEFDQLDDIYTK